MLNHSPPPRSSWSGHQAGNLTGVQSFHPRSSEYANVTDHQPAHRPDSTAANRARLAGSVTQSDCRVLFVHPNASAPAPIPLPSLEGETALFDELEWRSTAMRDETGVIPVGAAYLANLFRRQQLLLPAVPIIHGKRGNPATASYVTPASWTSRGPQNVGGRTRSLIIDPNSPSTMYAGAVSGGVWKTTNGGSTWTPLTDFMSNIAITTMVFDPTVANRSVIYAGTGESYLRGDGVQGAGVFKSTDSGGTWNQFASTATWTVLSRLTVNGSGVLLPAAKRGIFRSTDGGQVWTRTFSCSDADTSGNGLDCLLRSTQTTQAMQ